jgi:hypothetical protein
MGTIEDALRETFAAEVRRQPALDGMADRAVTHARRTRRTQVGVSAAAAMVAVVLAGGAAVSLHERLTVPPLAAGAARGQAAAARVPVDILVGNQIRSRDGRRIPFEETASVEAAYRIEDDWLVQARDLGATDLSLWSVRSDGTTKRLVTAVAVAVSPDGGRVAWATGDLLRVADLVDRRLINQRETRGRGDLVPYGFAGEAVLLTAQTVGAGPTASPGASDPAVSPGASDQAATPAGTAEPPAHPQAGEAVRFDLWFPTRGRYVPGPTPGRPVFGMGLDPSGTRLLGMAAVGPDSGDGPEFCLAELDLGSLEPVRSVCGLPIAPTSGLSIAPDGRRALVTGGSYLQLIDLDGVFDTGEITELSATAFDVVAWADDDTAVVSVGPSVVVFPLGPQNATAEAVPVNDVAPGESVRVIPRLR